MVPFQDSSNIIISGCSGSGKTHFVSRLIKYSQSLFTNNPQKIIYVYKHWQPLYSKLSKEQEHMLFMDSLPSEDELKALVKGCKHSLLVCDDMIREIGSNGFICDVFTRLSHHLNLSTILLVQNLSLPGKYNSTLCRNAHVSVLMKSAREAYGIRTLGVQLNDYHNLLAAYKDATQEPYSYLVCDTHPNSNPNFKYRTQIFPNDKYCVIVYKPK